MSNLLVVFGVTGQQGASVIHAVRRDPELSQRYSICGITMDVTKPSAQALIQQGIELVQADANKPETLPPSLKNAHTVFIVTTTIYEIHDNEREINQGKAIASASVAAGAKYSILSTATAAQKLYNRKVEAKPKSRALSGLARAKLFLRPGNFHAESPGGYESAPNCFQKMIEIISYSSDKKVVYNQRPAETFRTFIPDVQAKGLVTTTRFMKGVEYFGSHTKDEMGWTTQQARGTLTTSEEFLAGNPTSL